MRPRRVQSDPEPQEAVVAFVEVHGAKVVRVPGT